MLKPSSRAEQVVDAIMPFLAVPLAQLTCFKRTLGAVQMGKLMNEVIEVGRRCADEFIEDADERMR